MERGLLRSQAQGLSECLETWIDKANALDVEKKEERIEEFIECQFVSDWVEDQADIILNTMRTKIEKFQKNLERQGSLIMVEGLAAEGNGFVKKDGGEVSLANFLQTQGGGGSKRKPKR